MTAFPKSILTILTLTTLTTFFFDADYADYFLGTDYAD